MVFEGFGASRRAVISGSIALLAGGSGSACLWGQAAAVEADKPVRGAGPGIDLDTSRGNSAKIDGFRQARFGMTEVQLRQAIKLDFPALGDRIARSTNPKEKTAILSITADDLLPDVGSARIFYILGYKSKALVQINIVWSSDGKTGARDEAIVATANSLRDYFLAEFQDSPSIVVNRQIADNAIIVFRVEQADGRMLLLALNGIAAASNSDQKSTTPLTLEISYIRNHLHPDIFQIESGKF